MKGYIVPYGYVGLLNGKWVMFTTESEYVEAFKESEKEETK